MVFASGIRRPATATVSRDTEREARELLTGHEADVSVAATNTPDATVLSGAATALDLIERAGESRGIGSSGRRCLGPSCKRGLCTVMPTSPPPVRLHQLVRPAWPRPLMPDLAPLLSPQRRRLKPRPRVTRA